LIPPNQRVSAARCVNSPLCRLYVGGGHDLPLPEPVRNAILGRENAGILANVGLLYERR